MPLEQEQEATSQKYLDWLYVNVEQLTDLCHAYTIYINRLEAKYPPRPGDKSGDVIKRIAPEEKNELDILTQAFQKTALMVGTRFSALTPKIEKLKRNSAKVKTLKDSAMAMATVVLPSIKDCHVLTDTANELYVECIEDLLVAGRDLNYRGESGTGQ